MLDIDILRDHGVQATLIQSSETSRTMFVAVFNDIGDIHMINGVCRKHNYHQILQRCACGQEPRQAIGCNCFLIQSNTSR